MERSAFKKNGKDIIFCYFYIWVPCLLTWSSIVCTTLSSAVTGLSGLSRSSILFRPWGNHSSNSFTCPSNAFNCPLNSSNFFNFSSMSFNKFNFSLYSEVCKDWKVFEKFCYGVWKLTKRVTFLNWEFGNFWSNVSFTSFAFSEKEEFLSDFGTQKSFNDAEQLSIELHSKSFD